MPRYVIERNIPGAMNLTAEQLKDIAVRSNATVEGLGERYEWIESYVAGDRIYCIHDADNAEVIYRHARAGKFPADRVTEIAAIIGPDTANGAITRP